ncbi:hypothetical protein GNF76_04975 [Pseudomonas sp. CCM 7893]|uniref:Uncharacterized protein n=1 Tax=Pseudomonas spelaei TaxID=1055469 RepID=A0A6I3W8A3_9PSED|nr:hypothetical protein [Pseudomonas spelaei]MUF03673.1 hypothetical protein [Pseudomonas spelaei]
MIGSRNSPISLARCAATVPRTPAGPRLMQRLEAADLPAAIQRVMTGEWSRVKSGQ